MAAPDRGKYGSKLNLSRIITDDIIAGEYQNPPPARSVEPDRLPKPELRASVAQFGIGHLIHRRADSEKKDYWKDDTAEWLCGHRIPPFQRPAVWSQDQKVRFIESAWLGIHLGIYVVNRNDGWKNDRPHPMDLWLIDGQQRLRALDDYLGDVFPVFGYKWSELNKLERRRFESIPFAQATVHEANETKLRMLYDRLNFGGTPHTEDQRATKSAK